MKILIAGDFCPKDRVAKLIETGNYGDIFDVVKPVIENADIAIVNFETCVNEHGAEPIVKQGPNLCTTKKAVEAIKYAGFNVATLANNHFRDFGDSCVKESLDTLDANGIKHVGGGLNKTEAQHVLYLKTVDTTIAIINCCEHEFSIATDNTSGSNPLNPIRQYYSIQEAKKRADYVIVIVHGGHELHQLPSPRMVDTYRFFVDAGADVVINHHQHCFSGYETYNNKPIYYGLGNFCFDWDGRRDSQWNRGYMVQIDIENDCVSTKVIPYEQCNSSPCVKLLPEQAFDSSFEQLNRVISNRSLLKSATNDFYKSSKNEMEHFLNPYQTRLFRGLSRRGLFHSFFNKKWILKLQNVIMCESYRDKLEYYFNNYKYEK